MWSYGDAGRIHKQALLVSEIHDHPSAILKRFLGVKLRPLCRLSRMCQRSILRPSFRTEADLNRRWHLARRDSVLDHGHGLAFRPGG